MGIELWCGDKPGTLHMWNTIICSYEMKNVTPTKIANYMYKKIINELPQLQEARQRYPDNPIGYFLDDKPVITDADLKRYAKKIKNIWIKASKEKLEECRMI